MARIRTILIIAACCSATLWTACGDDDDDDTGQAGSTGNAGYGGAAGKGSAGKGGAGNGGAGNGGAGNGADSGAVDSGNGGSSSASAQTPPMGQAAIQAWLMDGAYNDWSCESKVHASRPPSPHGFNRICSNAVISDDADGTGDWAAGAAAVKELYTSASAKSPAGYAVYLKTAKSSDDGANWYWYGQVPDDSVEPHDSNGIAADGMGDASSAEAVCVSCHTAAGSDASHSPSTGSRDFVYTPVP